MAATLFMRFWELLPKASAWSELLATGLVARHALLRKTAADRHVLLYLIVTLHPEPDYSTLVVQSDGLEAVRIAAVSRS